jgi:hypothetical protein
VELTSARVCFKQAYSPPLGDISPFQYVTMLTQGKKVIFAPLLFASQVGHFLGIHFFSIAVFLLLVHASLAPHFIC